MNLSGKTVLTTGATGTLGKALSFAFRLANANLIVQGRDNVKLNTLEYELSKLKSPSFIRKTITDLSDFDQTIKLTRYVRKFSVDILINNAALQEPIGALETNNPKVLLNTVSVNFIAPVLLCRAMIPDMKLRSLGRIINISGGGATEARPFFSAYGSTKAAIVRLTETLAQELCETEITINDDRLKPEV